jgi:hypothetical protein
MSIYNILCGVRGIISGSQSYDTPGTYTLDMTVIPYNTMTISVYGAGGGAAYYNTGSYGEGTNGGTSSVVISQGTVQATGGQRGLVYSIASTGGTGSGPTGTTSATGTSSAQANPYPTGGTGAGPLGGAGGVWTGTQYGIAPGGGGGGYSTLSPGGNFRSVSGGGGGGYASFVTTQSIGSTVTIIVGAGGTAAGGVSAAVGGAGRVILTWS